MTPEQRQQVITELLTTHLNPSLLNVINESHLHAGHPGAASGASHFAVEISADELNNLSRLAAHQRIYALVGHLIPDEVHALRISIK